MSAARSKGTAAETALVNYLQSAGWPYAERRALAGSLDRGDIAGVPGICWEVKSAAVWRIPEWLRETEQERVNAGAEVGVLVAKTRRVGGPNAFRWLAVVDAEVVADRLGVVGVRDAVAMPRGTSHVDTSVLIAGRWPSLPAVYVREVGGGRFVFTAVGQLVVWLRAAGFGDPLTHAS